MQGFYWGWKYPEHTERLQAMAKALAYRELRGIQPHHAGKPLELLPQ